MKEHSKPVEAVAVSSEWWAKESHSWDLCGGVVTWQIYWREKIRDFQEGSEKKKSRDMKMKLLSLLFHMFNAELMVLGQHRDWGKGAGGGRCYLHK